MSEQCSESKLNNIIDTPLNCPNCGVPLGTADICPYCGTHFLDFAISTEKPFYIKIRHNGNLFIDRVRLQTLTVNQHSNDIDLYANDIKYITFSSPETTYELTLLSMGVNYRG